MPTTSILDTHSLTLQNECFHKIGRYPKNLDHLVVAWPGFVVKGAFKGSRLSLSAEARINFNLGTHLYLSIEIDGAKTQIAVEQSLKSYSLAEGLDPDQVHYFRIIRQNEAFCGNLILKELSTDGSFEAPTGSSLLIEAVGDSLLTGYGNEASQAHQPFNSKNQNFTKSMVFLAAEYLEADLRVIAHVGKGVQSNYDGSTHSTLIHLYDELTPYAPNTYEHNDSQAQLVILQGGSNDFSLSLPPKKRFIDAYVEWVRKVHQHQPDARLLALIGPMLNNDWPISPITGQAIPSLDLYKAWVQEASNELKALRIELNLLELTPQDASRGFGSHWHPNLLQHQLNAVEIANWLKENL